MQSSGRIWDNYHWLDVFMVWIMTRITRAIEQGWNKFWFTQASISSICLYRILCGLLMLAVGTVRAPCLLFWYGPRGLISIESVKHIFHISSFNLLLWCHQTNGTTWALFIAYMLSAVLLAVGFCTRTSAACAWLFSIAFNDRNPILSSHGDMLLAMSALLLVFAPAGRKFSIDSMRQRSSQAISDLAVPWVQRLFQLEIANVYFQCFMSKVTEQQWLNGDAIYYVTHLSGLRNYPITYLSDHQWACCLLAWGMLAVEFAMFTLVWIKQLRYWVLLAGAILHLGMDWSLYIPVFQYVMIALYVNYIDGKDVDRTLHWISDVLLAGVKGFSSVSDCCCHCASSRHDQESK